MSPAPPSLAPSQGAGFSGHDPEGRGGRHDTFIGLSENENFDFSSGIKKVRILEFFLDPHLSTDFEVVSFLGERE